MMQVFDLQRKGNNMEIDINQYLSEEDKKNIAEEEYRVAICHHTLSLSARMRGRKTSLKVINT